MSYSIHSGQAYRHPYIERFLSRLSFNVWERLYSSEIVRGEISDRWPCLDSRFAYKVP